MKTEFKDVAHLYKGSNFMFEDEEHELLCAFNEIIYSTEVDESGEGVFGLPDCKLILRPLSDITKEEKGRCDEICDGREIYWDSLDFSGGGSWEGGLEQIDLMQFFNLTKYLLSRGFDLFDLIESGQAIDKTKL